MPSAICADGQSNAGPEPTNPARRNSDDRRQMPGRHAQPIRSGGGFSVAGTNRTPRIPDHHGSGAGTAYAGRPLGNGHGFRVPSRTTGSGSHPRRAAGQRSLARLVELHLHRQQRPRPGGGPAGGRPGRGVPDRAEGLARLRRVPQRLLVADPARRPAGSPTATRCTWRTRRPRSLRGFWRTRASGSGSRRLCASPIPR